MGLVGPLKRPRIKYIGQLADSCLESSLPCLPASNPVPLGRVNPPYNPSLGTPLELADITRRHRNRSKKQTLKKDTQKVTKMLPEAFKINPKSIQNGAKQVSKSLLEAILQKNMKNSIWAAIYHTLGMSAHPQTHKNWSLWGKKITTNAS